MKRQAILGISAFYHDSAAALVVDGEIIAAAQEERFTRIKQDSNFPIHAIRYVLKEACMTYDQLSAVVFYDKPFLKFERLLETYHAFAPKGLRSFLTAMPVWLKEKLFMRRLIRKQLADLGKKDIPLLFSEHHLSHAASAFYPSPFEQAAILTVDGIGEWATATIGMGSPGGIRILKEMHFPHSLGLLYSAFTYFLGFKVNSGEYKLMGLAPYGDATNPETLSFHKKIITELVDIREDGSILLNMDYFRFATDLKMIHIRRWEKLFGISLRNPESEIHTKHMNLALAIQQVTESILIKLVHTTKELTGCGKLVMAGGVALNCVANSKIAATNLFSEIWIQPAAGDAGGALGAALAAYHTYFENRRTRTSHKDLMNNAYLGPDYNDKEVKQALDLHQANYLYYQDFNQLTTLVSQKLNEGKIIGWFQGRMEFGPRALGNRSILADPRNPEIQKILNLKVKFREGFRPFAPSVLEEDAEKFFDVNQPSPYMLFVSPVKACWRCPQDTNQKEIGLYERLYHPRSSIPAITHMDYSARLQTVSRTSNPRYWQLIDEFKKLTGTGMLVNTSFNVRGEPIVCSPEDAYRDFMFSDMDYLVIGNYLLERCKQPPLQENKQRNIYLD